MHTPGPGRTKDMEKKRSYPRSKHASQQEIALYVFGKKTKKANPLSWASFSSLASWLDTALCRAAVAVCSLTNESKVQLFPDASTSFWNTVPQPHWARGQGASCTHSQRAVFALSPASWSLVVSRAVWKVPTSETPAPRQQCGSVTHTLLQGELSLAARVFIRPSLTFTSDVLVYT